MIDQIIVGLYLFGTLLIGTFAGRRTNSMNDFAVGKRNFSSTVLLCTLFATVIDGGGTSGLAEATFSHGLMYCLTFLGIAISYILLALFIAPRFDPFLGLISSGDILGQLYGRKAKIFMGFATLFESVMLIGMQILAITHMVQYFFNISPQISAWTISFIVLIYSLRGGIRAVTATDVFQFAILAIAVPFVFGIAMMKIGSFDGLLSAIKSSPKPLAEGIDIFKQLALFATFCLPAIYPRTLQRMLIAKNVDQIKNTFIINGILVAVFYLVIGGIAVSAWVLLPHAEPHFVFSALVNELLPVGLKGLVVAGMLAVFMSSIDSDLNLAAIALSHDIIVPLSSAWDKEQ